MERLSFFVALKSGSERQILNAIPNLSYDEPRGGYSHLYYSSAGQVLTLHAYVVARNITLAGTGWTILQLTPKSITNTDGIPLEYDAWKVGPRAFRKLARYVASNSDMRGPWTINNLAALSAPFANSYLKDRHGNLRLPHVVAGEDPVIEAMKFYMPTAQEIANDTEANHGEIFG